MPSCDEEKEAPAVDQKRASATAAPPVHVRVRRDRDTDPSGGDERVEWYGQEGRGRGGWVKERGDEAGERDVGEVLQYWILEKPFPYGVHPTVKKNDNNNNINI